MSRFSLLLIARIITNNALVACALFALAASASPAHAEFVLSPLRQVVTEQNPKAYYEVSNPSPRTLELRLSWIDLEAQATGYRKASPDLRKNLSAAPYLVLSKSFFRLQPGAREAFIIQLKEGATPPDGERRSHLLIESTAVRSPLRKAGGGIQLDVQAGLSTPVILRRNTPNDHTSLDVNLRHTRLTRDADGGLILETVLKTSGAFSAYGAVTASFTPRDPLQVSGLQELGRIANVAAYPDGPGRIVEVPLGRSVLPEGVLSITYEGDAEFKGTTFAVRTFNIAPPE